MNFKTFGIVFTLLSIFVATATDECGGLCECDTAVVSCHYLTRFPEFENDSQITDLILTFSDVLGVPSFKTRFPRLESLTFRQCRYVKCSLIERLHRERPSLRIVHSETCTTLTPQPTTPQSTTKVGPIICYSFTYFAKFISCYRKFTFPMVATGQMT